MLIASGTRAQLVTPPNPIPTLGPVNISGSRDVPFVPWLGHYATDRCNDFNGNHFVPWYDISCFWIEDYVEDLPYWVDPDGNGVVDGQFSENERHRLCSELSERKNALGCPLHSYPAMAGSLLSGVPGLLETLAQQCMLSQDEAGNHNASNCTSYVLSTVAADCAYEWTPPGEHPETVCFDGLPWLPPICFTTPAVTDLAHPLNPYYAQCVYSNELYVNTRLFSELIANTDFYTKTRRCAEIDFDRQRLSCGQ